MSFNLSIRSLLFGAVLLAISAVSSAQIGIAISIRTAPPELPIYEQPILPEDGYIWTPGYWAYSDEDYYWVPGTWVMAPEPGYLWTPGYWGEDRDDYVFHEGYWGTEVGFYGGINYGYGYSGRGYEGGRWDNGRHYAINLVLAKAGVHYAGSKGRLYPGGSSSHRRGRMLDSGFLYAHSGLVCVACRFAS